MLHCFEISLELKQGNKVEHNGIEIELLDQISDLLDIQWRKHLT